MHYRWFNPTRFKYRDRNKKQHLNNHIWNEEIAFQKLMKKIERAIKDGKEVNFYYMNNIIQVEITP